MTYILNPHFIMNLGHVRTSTMSIEKIFFWVKSNILKLISLNFILL